MLYVCKQGQIWHTNTHTFRDSSSNKWLSTNGPVQRRKPLRIKNCVRGCEFEKKGYVPEEVGLRKLQNESFLMLT